MIRVTVELVPHGKDSKASTLQVIEIVNTGLAYPRMPDFRPDVYRYTVFTGDLCAVVIHDRTDDVLKLVRKAVNEISDLSLPEG